MTTTATHPKTLLSLLSTTASEHANQPALASDDGSESLTWGEYYTAARVTAAGLAGLDVSKGATLALWLSNQPRFHSADAGALLLGAAPFSIYPTFTVAQAEHVIADAGNRVLITERAFYEQACAVRDRGKTALESIVLVDSADAHALTWEEMLACASDGFDVDEAAAAIGPDDLATLIYTSGTTGPPKGVELTHRNIVAQVETLQARLRPATGTRAISWLPMAHVAERLCTHYMPIVRGWHVTTCANPAAIVNVVREVRPEFFFAPPRLWEKLRAQVLAGADEVARGQLEDAIAAVRSGSGPVDSTLGSEIQRRLGFSELRTAIVGAAPCPAEVIEFWHAVGVPLSEVYGMSETTGVATVNPPGAIRIGTVGTPLDGVELCLSDEKEILIRGPVVMDGYRNAADKTAEALDPDGWLHTGDLGALDAEGYVRIVGRIKELIINAAGKNMSPTNIEATVKAAGELIGQVCVIGDGRPFNTALVTLDPDGATTYAGRCGLTPPSLPDLAANEVIRREVEAQIERANANLARVEQIKRFRLLDHDWQPGGDELTPTMKLKREPIAAKYTTEIESLYSRASS